MRTFDRAVFFWIGLLTGVSAAAQPAGAERRVPINTAVATFTAKTERVSDEKTKLVLSPKEIGGAGYKLHDAAGQEMAVTVARDGTIEAVVDPKLGYILSPKQTKRQPLVKEGLQFPGRYITGIATGAPKLGGLFLRPARAPLTWDDAAKAYVTELAVGYEFDDGVARPLAAPKKVIFFTEGSRASIKLDTVEIKESGVSGYQRVTLSTQENAGETLFTARAGPADELKSSASVQREPGSLQLTLPSAEIAAYGVGSGTLTVTLIARDGEPLEATEALAVQLSSRRLRLPATIALPAKQSSTEVEFRSTGFGTEKIVARAAGLTGSQDVRLIFPVAAVIAAVAGGALGGVTRYVRNQRQQRKGSTLFVRRLLEGVLVGTIFVGAAWAGLVSVNVGTGILGTPFGALVLAALSGYVGCVLLDRLTKKTFKTLDGES